MSNGPTGDITALLGQWRDGDRQAERRVAPLLYGTLRSIAGSYLRHERQGHTLEPTALVHEAWIQLSGPAGIQDSDLRWQSRAHFFGIAARIMRRVLVDYGRARGAAKRGRNARRITLHTRDEPRAQPRPVELIAIDRALETLARVDPTGAHLVELRFFGGLTVEEAAAFLGLSRTTTNRRWRRVRAWLHATLSEDLPPGTARVARAS